MSVLSPTPRHVTVESYENSDLESLELMKKSPVMGVSSVSIKLSLDESKMIQIFNANMTSVRVIFYNSVCEQAQAQLIVFKQKICHVLPESAKEFLFNNIRDIQYEMNRLDRVYQYDYDNFLILLQRIKKFKTMVARGLYVPRYVKNRLEELKIDVKDLLKTMQKEKKYIRETEARIELLDAMDLKIQKKQIRDLTCYYVLRKEAFQLHPQQADGLHHDTDVVFKSAELISELYHIYQSILESHKEYFTLFDSAYQNCALEIDQLMQKARAQYF